MTLAVLSVCRCQLSDVHQLVENTHVAHHATSVAIIIIIIIIISFADENRSDD